MISLFLLSLRSSTLYSKLSTPFVSLVDFGFEAGGNYQINIFHSSKPIIFGLINDDQYDAIENEAAKFDKEEYCGEAPTTNFSVIQHYVPANSALVSITGTIQTKNVYHLFVFNCEDDKFNVKYSYSFSNPNSKLDYREYPSLIEYPVAIAIYCILMILWIINWIINKRLKIYIHFILSAAFILAFISSIARYGALKYADANHYSIGIQSIFIVIDLLFSIGLFIFIVLASKGWCIVRETIKFSELILAIVFTVGYLICQTVYAYTSFGTYDLIVILLMIIFIALYVWQLISAINSATLHIRAHLLAIQNAGIDAKTTPIWQKNIMYNMLQWSIIVFLFLIIIHIFVDYFLSNVQWVDGFLYDIQNITILVLLGINFRLRGPDAENGYTMIQENDEFNEFMLSDIEGINLNSREFQTGGTPWQSGMKLPGQPQIVQTPSIATLETPDGTSDIIIQPGSY